MLDRVTQVHLHVHVCGIDFLQPLNCWRLGTESRLATSSEDRSSSKVGHPAFVLEANVMIGGG